MRFFYFVNLFVLSVLFMGPYSAQAQEKKAVFKVTERSTPSTCNGKGCSYDKGYVKASEQKEVNVALFVQHINGYWEKKEYVHTGSGYIDLKLSSCDYTGNYYAFACFSDDPTCSFPSELEIETDHKAKDQTPKFKVLDIERTACSETGEGLGKENVVFVKGYVYSPKGTQVEVTLFLEKNDGKWRKKHYMYHGTGVIELDASGCDLTGNYKAIVQYIE